LKTKPTFFYGYVIVLAAFCSTVVIWGIFYSFGVFFEPVLREFGWTRAVTSGAYSLCMALHGLLAIGMGRLTDRFGPRLVITACGLFFGLGHLLMSQISAAWQLYLFYGVIVSIGLSASFVPTTSTIARWFVKRRGMMTGIVVGGMGLGTMFIPPLVSRFISIYGWRTSYIIVGSVAMVLVILVAQFLRRDPGQMGLSPYGENEVKQERLTFQAMGLSFQEAIQTRQLWLLCAIYFCFWFSLSTIFVHIVIHATGLGISAANAAIILAVIGGVKIPGTLIIGSSADKIGNKLGLIICLVLISTALFWLMAARGTWMLYPFAAILGFAYGGVATLMSPVVAELFGLSSHGVILGFIFFIDCLGGAIGPVLAGRIFDITGSYQWAFLICAALSVIALILTSLLRPTHSKDLTQNI